MKKIIFFAKDLNQGNIEKSLINLLNRLVTSYNITLVLEKNEGSLKRNINKKIKIIEYKVYKSKLLNKLKELFFRVKYKNKYNFSCSYLTETPLNKLSRISSTNNAIYIHNDYTQKYKKEKINHFFNSINITEFKHIIFESNESKKTFCKNFPNLKDKTLVINNLINTKEILKKSK